MEEERHFTDADLEHIFQAVVNEADSSDGQLIALKTITNYLACFMATRSEPLAKALLRFLENPPWPEEIDQLSPEFIARKEGFERAARGVIESLRHGIAGKA